MNLDSCEAAISRAVGVGVLVGGTGVGVLVGGTGVAVGVGDSVGVAVGTGVWVGVGVFVGGTGVAVGVGDGVLVDSIGVAVAVAVGGGVGVGSGAVAASGGGSSGVVVAVGETDASPQAIAAAVMPTANRHAQRMDGCLDALFAGLGMLCLGSSSLGYGITCGSRMAGIPVERCIERGRVSFCLAR